MTGRIESFSHIGSPKDKKKKDKDKGKKGPARPFNLAAEQDQMKTTIAESSIAATNLLNALQTINRELERISDNAAAVHHFETCKQLRRKILRYVSQDWRGHSDAFVLRRTGGFLTSSCSVRFITSSPSSGSAACSTPTTSLSQP